MQNFNIDFNLADRLNKIKNTQEYKATYRITSYIPDENNAYEIYKFIKQNHLKPLIASDYLFLMARIIDRKLNLNLDTGLYYIGLSYFEKLKISKYYTNHFRKFIEPYLVIRGNSIEKIANQYDFEKIIGKTFLSNSHLVAELIPEFFSQNYTEKEFKTRYKNLIEKIKVDLKKVKKDELFIMDKPAKKEFIKEAIERYKKEGSNFKTIKVDRLKIEKVFTHLEYLKNLLENENLEYYKKRNIEKAIRKLERDIKVANLNKAKLTSEIEYIDNISENNGRNYHKIATLSKTTREILFDNYYSIDINNCAPNAIWFRVEKELKGPKKAKEKFPLYHQYATTRSAFFNRFHKPEYITEELKNTILKAALVGLNFGSDLVRDIKAFETLIFRFKNFNIKKMNNWELDLLNKSQFYEKFKDLEIDIFTIHSFLRIEHNFLLVKKIQKEIKEIREILKLNKNELANYFMKVESLLMNNVIKFLKPYDINVIRIHDEILVRKSKFKKVNFNKFKKLFSFKLNLKKIKEKNLFVEFNFKFKIKDLKNHRVADIKNNVRSIILDIKKFFKKSIENVFSEINVVDNINDIKNKIKLNKLLDQTKSNKTLVPENFIEIFRITLLNYFESNIFGFT